MNVSVNVDFLFGKSDLNYIDAIKESCKIGFKDFEVVFLEDKSIDALDDLRGECGAHYEVLMTQFIPWLEPNRYNEFVEAADMRSQVAKKLGCDKMIFFTGNTVDFLSHEEQLDKMEEIVKDILPFMERDGVKLLLEPINNKIDHKEANVVSTQDGVNLVKKIDSPNFRLLFDIYHMQIMEGDVTRTIINNMDIIEHLHCAGNPGRNEIFLGELDYPRIITMLKEKGYSGTVGIEYAPTIDPLKGLSITYDMLKDL